MSKYTTGELARLCGVSIRTVQYYDGRGILVPSELSEGGRRLYTEDDLKRMHVICFLREAGFSINSISVLFKEKHPEGIVSLLLDRHEQELREALDETQKKLTLIEGIKRELREIESFSVESIGDIAHMMKQKNKLKRMRWGMVLSGIPVTAFQWTSIVLWITHGLWWLFLLWAAIAIPWGIAVSAYYFTHVAYICPTCHGVFKPTFKDALFAYHTPRMRRLHCPTCATHALCLEIYMKKENDCRG